MLSRRQIKGYWYHYGLKAGMPYEPLRKVADVYDATLALPDYLTRKATARRLVSNSKWAGFIAKSRGYATFGPDELPGVASVLPVARDIYQRRREHKLKEGEGRKNPFVTLLAADDLRSHSELLDFALSDPILQIVTDYLGIVPRLDYIDIWISTPLPGLRGSHLYHLDKPEVPNVSMFVNIFDVGPQNGPFALLPADTSETIRKETQYEKIYFSADGRLPDDAVMRRNSEEKLVKFMGAAGSGGFVDTSRCFHQGSRCESGERVVMTMRYRVAHKLDGGLGDKLDGYRSSAGDQVKQLVLAI